VPRGSVAGVVDVVVGLVDVDDVLELVVAVEEVLELVEVLDDAEVVLVDELEEVDVVVELVVVGHAWTA